MFLSTPFIILKNIQKLIWVVLVLFSMSSCSVKQALLDQFQFSLEKSINPTRSLNSCQFSTIEKKSEKKNEIQNKIISTLISSFTTFEKVSFKFISVSFQEINNNSPPFYILYQQLKIALVI